MRKFKETKKQFDKVREDMELSLVRNAQAPRHRPHEVEEATGALTLTRKCFRHLALDYVLQVSTHKWSMSGLGGCTRSQHLERLCHVGGQSGTGLWLRGGAFGDLLWLQEAEA